MSTTITWLYDLGQAVALQSGHRATVTRRIESLSKTGDITRIYTARAERGDGSAFSIEVGESKLRSA